MSAPRIPTKEKYWLKKGKIGKQVIIHTHDDLDGIYSAIAVKQYLESRNFKLVGINIVNYQDSWSNTKFRPEYINICVDYAESHPMIDCYIDHHGQATTGNIDNKSPHVVKSDHNGEKIESAYHLVCRQLGMAVDSLTSDVINMIDSATYDQRNVIISKCYMNYDKLAQLIIKNQIYNDLTGEKQSTKGLERLYIGASINQMIKRGDHTSLIEVIFNTKSPSIYAIFHNFKHYYPQNHKKGTSFVEDSNYRKSVVLERTHKYLETPRKIYQNDDEFFTDYKNGNIKGYSIINNVAFIPTGCWANSFRARAIIDIDREMGNIPILHKIDYIILQYGNTIQVCGYDSHFRKQVYKKDDIEIEHLGEYTKYLLDNFVTKMMYDNIDGNAGSDGDSGCITTGGGHVGIGTNSNIVGRCYKSEHKDLYNMKFLDLFKNKMIRDLTGLPWKINNKWYRDGDEQHNKYIDLLVKNSIITENQRTDFLNKHIKYTTKLLDKYGIPYNVKKHLIDADKRFLFVENIKQTQKL